MKRILLLMLCIPFVNFSFGQLQSGTKFTEDIVVTDLLSGEQIDVQAELASGKTVILDMFATWCGPCWGMKEAGVLETLAERYGKDGSDEVVIIGIEADERTAESLLYEEANGGSQATSSFGDWTEGVKYHLANDHTHNNKLNIAFFPTVYVISPDQTIIEVSIRFVSQPDVYEKYIFGTENDAGLLGGFGSGTFCGTSYDFVGAYLVYNFGSEMIQEATVDVVLNDEIIDTYVVNDLAPYSEVILDTETYTTDIANSGIKLVLNQVNGVDDADDSISESFVASNLQRTLDTKLFTIVFTTDFYPTETSLKVTDAEGNIYLAESYSGNANGGGADANQIFNYELELKSDEDINCLDIEITDTWGDGLTGYDTTLGHPIPGVVVLNQYGVEIKEGLELDYSFGMENNIFVNFAGLTDIAEINELETTKVYPNPVSSLLNIELNFTEITKYNIMIADVYGQTVRNIGQYNNANLNEKVDISDLASGIYFVSINTGSGQNVLKFTKI